MAAFHGVVITHIGSCRDTGKQDGSNIDPRDFLDEYHFLGVCRDITPIMEDQMEMNMENEIRQ